MKIETIDDMAPVMGADGEFHAQDEAVDLSGTKPEAWVALGFFWLLGATVFYQFFTRYVLNNSAAWTEEIARYLLIAVVFTGATIGVVKNNHIQVDFFYKFMPRRMSRALSTLVDWLRVGFYAAAAVLTDAAELAAEEEILNNDPRAVEASRGEVREGGTEIWAR